MSESPPSATHKNRYDPLQVELPLFDGPLDLLLHLVRQRKLDINALKLSEITEPYLSYVEQMAEIDLDRAGEFLTIAAQLILIKSRTLLPKELAAEEEDDPESLEEMLLLRLQQYQQIKEAASDIARRDMLGREVFPRQAPRETDSQLDTDPVFEEVTLYGLIEAFREVLSRSEQQAALHIIPDQTRIEDRLHQLVETLAAKRSVYFHDLFPAGALRDDIILTFISILELVRMRAIRIAQTRPQGEIYCEVTEEFESGDAHWEQRVMRSLLGKEPAEEAPVIDSPPDSRLDHEHS